MTHQDNVKKLVERLQERGLTGFQILLVLNLKNLNYLTAAQALINAGYALKVHGGVRYPDEEQKVIVITDDNGKEKTFIWYFQASHPTMTQDRRTTAPMELPRWVKATSVKVANDGYIITYKDQKFRCGIGAVRSSGNTLRYVTVYSLQESSWLNIEFEFTPASYV